MTGGNAGGPAVYRCAPPPTHTQPGSQDVRVTRHVSNRHINKKKPSFTPYSTTVTVTYPPAHAPHLQLRKNKHHVGSTHPQTPSRSPPEKSKHRPQRPKLSFPPHLVPQTKKNTAHISLASDGSCCRRIRLRRSCCCFLPRTLLRPPPHLQTRRQSC